MQLNVQNEFDIQLDRTKGGAFVKARVDAWKATDEAWELAGTFALSDVLQKNERRTCTLPDGASYLCVFQCEIEESLNGIYAYDFYVNNTKVVFGAGDVNTTKNPHDGAAAKAQFMLLVR